MVVKPSTSLRQFKRGTVLNYRFTIYNAKFAGASPNVSYQTRLFRDNKPIFESNVQPVVSPLIQSGEVSFAGSLSLGAAMEPGDYVVQVVVTDNLAKSKRNSAMQFVQFEVID